jgi:hypothetical protein
MPDHIPDAHTRAGAWLPKGRTLADLCGERCLVRPSRALDRPLIEHRVVEVCPSRAYVRVESGPAKVWLRVEDYQVVEVLRPDGPDARADAKLWALLGTDDVRNIVALLSIAYALLPDERFREQVRRGCPKFAPPLLKEETPPAGPPTPDAQPEGSR